MPDPASPFANVLLPIDAALAAHGNPVTAILAGRGGDVRLAAGDHAVEGAFVMVRPHVLHAVTLPPRGADVLYLNGFGFPTDAPLAVSLTGGDAYAAEKAFRSDAAAMAALRDRLRRRDDAIDPRVARVVRAIHAEPMQRMTQHMLARHLGLERTQALRCFKSATGQTFRGFKAWSGVQHASTLMLRGALVRTAAMDSGFSDTAHLSRVFRHAFGLTPQAAIAGLKVGARH